jgi:solute carrier family 39 (zinc transporter), member 7
VLSIGWVRTFELVDHTTHVTDDGFFQSNRTFIGIAVHKAAATGSERQLIDLAAGVRQDATGLLGTTTQLADLVSTLAPLCSCFIADCCARGLFVFVQVIPFVAGGFLYIGAVAVLPTYVDLADTSDFTFF